MYTPITVSRAGFRAHMEALAPTLEVAIFGTLTLIVLAGLYVNLRLYWTRI
ncbi:hypothetical protein OB919_06600 [Halobacteria archaeon AArc-curdl1]|uniref:Uncharacterized protein n=1 Tax=Natronosalvus hydrolyticus TaxID=2979988 RepID=A0AAP2Z7U0_9EURY|nr:hypothetical protein [Halobacteria archaeon AArc-curdl1]